MENQNFFETISHEFDLTDEELLKKAKLAAKKNSELKSLTCKFEEMKKAQKGTLDVENGELQILLEHIKTGKESRQVNCRVEKDYKECVIKYFYNDIIIKEREMDAWEKQMHLDEIKNKKGIEKIVDEKLDQRMKDISPTNPENEKSIPVDPGNFPGDVN
jgi:hypothetical protein